MLNEKEELLLKNKDFADTFNEYFASIAESLDLLKWENKTNVLGFNDSNQANLDIIIRKYGKHPIIQIIKQKFRIRKKNLVQLVSKDEVTKIIKDLKNNKKCCTFNNHSNKNYTYLHSQLKIAKY